MSELDFLSQDFWVKPNKAKDESSAGKTRNLVELDVPADSSRVSGPILEQPTTAILDSLIPPSDIPNSEDDFSATPLCSMVEGSSSKALGPESLVMPRRKGCAFCLRVLGRSLEHKEQDCRRLHRLCFGCGSPDHKVFKCCSVVCYYCHKTGHRKRRCRRLLGACFRCGSLEHLIADCTRKTRSGASKQTNLVRGSHSLSSSGPLVSLMDALPECPASGSPRQSRLSSSALHQSPASHLPSLIKPSLPKVRSRTPSSSSDSDSDRSRCSSASIEWGSPEAMQAITNLYRMFQGDTDYNRQIRQKLDLHIRNQYKEMEPVSCSFQTGLLVGG